MKTTQNYYQFDANRSSWIYYLLLLFVAEKVIQHMVVTLAFYFNWTDIASTVAVSPRLLMISGGLVAVLFTVSLWGLIKKHKWAVNLVMALALFDTIGEILAQGKIDIVITVSFLVAVLLLGLSLIFGRQSPKG